MSRVSIIDYASWGQMGAAGTVLGMAPGLGNRTATVTVADADGNDMEIVPVRVEASYVSRTADDGGWECSSLTLVGVPLTARSTSDLLASQYVGPLAVAGVLARLPAEFSAFVERNNPRHR